MFGLGATSVLFCLQADTLFLSANVRSSFLHKAFILPEVDEIRSGDNGVLPLSHARNNGNEISHVPG